ncbi:unnamed protein product [Lactuca saligna]|uniref:Uncharacterized protein n=1 Tax=Lactuca saligna TaxID=75948 RepID=A0AA35ZHV8_LACSI|nr:unnamed protein product [Lactuca saligna]
MNVGAKLIRWKWRWTGSLSGYPFIFSSHRRRTFCIQLHSCKSNPPYPFRSPDTGYYKPKAFSNTLYGYNIRLTELGRLGKVHDARKLFDEMPQRDIVSYASMITVYIKNNDLFSAEALFHTIPERNIVADSAMIDAYTKAGRMDDAWRIFDQMPRRNVYSWTSLISGLFRNGLVSEGQKLFDEMPGKNVVSWTLVLLGYAHNGLIDQARAIFDQTPNKNVVVWTAMIKVYIDNLQTDEALKLFNSMPLRNLYSWNIMIQGCFNDNRTKEAIDLFTSMPKRNHVSWTTMVTGLAQNSSTNLARQYFNQMPRKDIAAWNAMITAYTNEGLMTEANELFHTMPERNVVSWNAIIGGYAKAGPRGLEHEISLANSLITMYAKCGDLESAKLAFDTFHTKDIVSWTAMMLAYSTHGFGPHAIQIFGRMLRLGFQPDEITFLALLTACSHTGLVDKGWKFFNSMMHVYNVGPKSEHYACLVDILGRAGQLDKALKVVDQMPHDMRDGVALGALLGACKLHGDDELASEIGQKVIDFEPNESGGYVLLANVFAASGRWEEVAKVRREMKGKVSSKLPGFSQVYVKGCNYVFFVGDRSHTNFDEINEMLRDKILPEMKLMSKCYFVEDLM